jgi:hypothetical protein
MKEIED